MIYALFKGHMSLYLVGVLIFIACITRAQDVSIPFKSLTNGSVQTFVVPEGVTSITVECWGGGGAGGNASNKGTGGGGAGGSYARKTLTVIPGTRYDVYVGGIKTSGSTALSNNGNPSWFAIENSSTALVRANGGNGGSPGNGGAGAGGTVQTGQAIGIGDILYSGGAGSNAGSGGGCAGSTGTGKSPTNSTGGTSTALNGDFSSGGGNGANGPTNNNTIGSSGTTYGGGGGGAKSQSNLMSGGSGAAGIIIVSYKKPVIVTNPAALSFGYVPNGITSSTLSFQLSGQNLSPSSGSIIITAPSNFQVSLSDIPGSFTNSLSIPYTIATLSARTIYVRFNPTTESMDYNDNILISGGGAATSIITVTGTSKIQYCNPLYTTGTSSGDYITLVQLGTINNTSGASTISPYYTYYNSLTTDLKINSSYTITLSAGTYATGNNISVWIDYNRNGEFELAEKLGNVTPGATPVTASISFTVPLTATIGKTRMRVREVYGQSTIDPCANYTYGETEDYDVNILGQEIPLSATCVTTSTCSGSATGSITVTAVGGSSPYQYSLNSGPYQPSNIFSGLLPSNYNITVKDASNSTITISTTVGTQPASTMPVILANVINTSCPETQDGAITITNIPTALEFKRAESDYINLGSSMMNGLSKFTIEGWVKINKSELLPSDTRVWGLFGQNDAIEFGIMNSTTLQLWTVGGGTLNISMDLYPDDNNWHHIAGTGDGAATRVYIDGVQVGINSTSTTNYGSSTYNTMIGGHVWDATGNYINGSIIKVGFWNRALSGAELQSLASSKFHEYYQDEFGLIAGYNFFEGNGTALSKVGTATTNGTLINSPEWKDIFTYSWSKTGDPTFTATTRNITLIKSGEYNLSANLPGSCPFSGTWTVSSLVINKWTGSIDNNWNLVNNWTCNIPKITSDAIIPSGLARYPILSSGSTGTCKNLIIGSGASVIVDGNTLQIAESIQNSGSLTATAGTIEMKGSSAQVIPASCFLSNRINNLIINNLNGVTLNGTLEISGYLKAQTGDFQTNGYLTLLSTVTGTALIDGTGAGNVLGSVTMQRYLPSAFGYKYFSSPFSNATVAEFADDIDLGASFATMYRYEQNKVSTGWDKYITPSAQLTPGIGYSLNFGSVSTPKTVSMKGLVNNNPVSLTLYNHNQPYTKGFNLVGNPYPSPIDWNAAGWTKTNIDNALYYFNAGTTDQYLGVYSSCINGVSSDGKASNIIAAQQGFFVHVSNGTFPVQGTLTFTNQVRVNNLNPLFFKNAATSPTSYIRISAKHDGSEIADYMVVYFNDGMTEDFDPSTDALKLLNTDPSVPNIYTRSRDGKDLSIEAISYPIDNTVSIPLVVSSAKKGTITLKASQIVELPHGYYLYLKDNQTGKILDLQSSPEYRFDANEETLADRFTIVLSKSKLSQEILGTKSFNAFIQDGTVYLNLSLKEEQVMVQVTDLMGRTILKTSVYGEGNHKLGLLKATGVYIVSLYTDMGIISKKIYLK